MDFELDMALQNWDSFSDSPSANVAEKGLDGYLLEHLKSQKYVTNKPLYHCHSHESRLKHGDTINYWSCTSWSTDVNDLVRRSQNYPVIVMTYIPDRPISALENYNQPNFQEIILAPTTFRVLRSETKDFVISYHLTPATNYWSSMAKYNLLESPNNTFSKNNNVWSFQIPPTNIFQNIIKKELLSQKQSNPIVFKYNAEQDTFISENVRRPF
jgi:hypothetical protein